MFSVYLRLHLPTSATSREVIRAASTRLSAEGKGRHFRAARHAFYRAMLEQHRMARHLHLFVVSGEQ